MGRLERARFDGERMPEVPPGMYRHVNGTYYKVLFTCLCTQTKQESIVYTTTEDVPRIFVTPLTSFLSAVHVEGKEVPKFERVVEELEAVQ